MCAHMFSIQSEITIRGGEGGKRPFERQTSLNDLDRSLKVTERKSFSKPNQRASGSSCQKARLPNSHQMFVETGAPLCLLICFNGLINSREQTAEFAQLAGGRKDTARRCDRN